MKLDGARVLLTGATGGLGQAIARGLAERGATLTLTGRRAEVLEPLAAEVGGRVIVSDLSEADAPARLLAEAGEVDVLVANAGLPGSGRLNSFTPEEIDRALDVNLRAPMLLAHGLTESMVARGSGHLLFMSSLSGRAAAPGTSVYAATKFGLRGFALALREDLAPKGVGVSVILPGLHQRRRHVRRVRRQAPALRRHQAPGGRRPRGREGDRVQPRRARRRPAAAARRRAPGRARARPDRHDPAQARRHRHRGPVREEPGRASVSRLRAPAVSTGPYGTSKQAPLCDPRRPRRRHRRTRGPRWRSRTG